MYKNGKLVTPFMDRDEEGREILTHEYLSCFYRTFTESIILVGKGKLRQNKMPKSVSTFHEVATNHPFLSLSPVGFNKLENLEAFNKVKAMCVFNNALKKIEGMDHMTRMQ